MGLQTEMRIYTRKRQVSQPWDYLECMQGYKPPDPWVFFKEMHWGSHIDLDYLLQKPGAAYLSTNLDWDAYKHLRARKRRYSNLISNPVLTPLEDIATDAEYIYILEGDFVFRLYDSIMEVTNGSNTDEDTFLRDAFKREYELIHHLKEKHDYEFVIEYWFV